MAAENPRGRKILVARTRSEGKELLRQVVLGGRSWIGFEVATARALAMRIAAPKLAAQGLRTLDFFDEQALAERALDEALLGERAPGARERFPGLAERVGFRAAARRSAAALRTAGIRARQVAQASGPGATGRQALIASVLARYESLLEDQRLADRATALETAAAMVASDEAPTLADATVALIPGPRSQGLEGRFLRALESAGAVRLETDPVEGLPAPSAVLWKAGPAEAQGSHLYAVERWTAAAAGEGANASPTPEPLAIELFAAGSVHDELRGVLRRVAEREAAWDEVEIVAPDAAAYGSALHAVTEPLGIPVTYALGLPVERTRPGRVVATFFKWIESDFQESIVRALIEAGDVAPAPPRDWLAGPRLARALRRLRIGWGRARYMRRIDRALENLERPQPGLARRQTDREGRADDLSALKDVLGPVLAALPDVRGRASPADVATAARALLEKTAAGTATDGTAQHRLTRRLDRIRATLDRTTDFSAAAAIVKALLEIQVPAPRAEGSAPWSSAPGHLYLAGLENGGATGRAHTFLVGLDATSLSGSGREDPMLLDRERMRIGKGELPFAGDRAAESRFGFAVLFARLRGRVTLSYARWDPSQARAVAPAPEMLQALRLARGDAACDFDELQRRLGPSESRLPRPERPVDLDASDAWLRALATDDGRLRDGVAAVSRAHSRLGRGMEAKRALEEGRATVHTGFLGTRWPPLSHRTLSERAWSASRLEGLGACPRRFLFHDVLRISPPDDPEFDGHRWLDALQRGSLLHAAFERSLRLAREREVDFDDPAFPTLALECADREVQRAVPEIPAPSPVVRDMEIEALRLDVASFVEMIRETRPPWSALEWAFGMDGEPVELALPATDSTKPRTLKARGYVDRIDDLGESLRIVDYKTGSDYGYGKDAGAFRGGRRLQHVLYAAAAAQETGKPVGAVEYHFPTRRGENRVRAYPAPALAGGLALIGALMASAEAGAFPATDSAGEDCRFCDYQECCGVRASAWGANCRIADWTREHLETLPELATLRRARAWEDEGRGGR